VDTLDRQVQSLKILRATMIAAVAFYVVLGEFLMHPVARAVGPAAYVIVAIGASLLAIAYGVRNSMAAPVEEILRKDPEDMFAVIRWRSFTMLSLILCETVGLLGFMLRLLGGPPILAYAMYAISIAYLFMLAPRRP